MLPSLELGRAQHGGMGDTNPQMGQGSIGEGGSPTFITWFLDQFFLAVGNIMSYQSLINTYTTS